MREVSATKALPSQLRQQRGGNSEQCFNFTIWYNRLLPGYTPASNSNGGPVVLRDSNGKTAVRQFFSARLPVHDGNNGGTATARMQLFG